MKNSPPLALPDPADFDEDEDQRSAFGYQQTLMYGRYSKQLGEQLKEEARRIRQLEKQRKVEYKKQLKELSGQSECSRRVRKVVSYFSSKFLSSVGEDWVFLALLGIIVAVISFCMDYTILLCNQARIWLAVSLVPELWAQFLVWTFLSVFLILFSAGFTHLVSPQAIGSGLPELKTIMRGVLLPEYLTFRTLVAKVVGLTATLGAGMPLGKEGPFVHLASCVATVLSKYMGSFQGKYENESRQTEMLAAACAVGVATCFGAPIGGVLFSIEVTAVLFEIRNYWRGFFAATFGAVIFRLLAIWSLGHPTFFAFFKTEFMAEFLYDPQELIVFALIGVISGLGGALWVFLHRRYVLWMRGNKQLSKFLQQNRFIYPFFISFLLAACIFPGGLGDFNAGVLTTHQQVDSLFSNFTWTRNISEMSVTQYEKMRPWMDPYTQNVFVSLAGFTLYVFFGSLIGCTLPVPAGIVIPSFKVGAGIGRIIGELMAMAFPEGVSYSGHLIPIVPGGYAVVGAAAFTGSTTQTISIAMIIFEMTGQKTHCIPVLIAVIIANCISSLLGPSAFDSIILIKNLPYLPNIIPSSSNAYNYFVESFMLKSVKYIWHGMTYNELKQVLKETGKVSGFPLVDHPEHMILLGSVPRAELVNAVQAQIGRERRQLEATRRRREERARAIKEEFVRQLQEKTRRLEPDSSEDPEEPGLQPNMERRPSRFAISSVGGKGVPELPLPESYSNTTTLVLPEVKAATLPIQALMFRSGSQSPKKSILKKKSFPEDHDTIHSADFQPPSPYMELMAPQERWRNTIHSMQQLLRKGGPADASGLDSRYSTWDTRNEHTFTGIHNKKKLTRPDLTLEEQRVWEEQEMARPVDFSNIRIDPAPFQLVEKTSILKVHSMFSMLGVNCAYVTTLGRLIGVVGLVELRKAIEDVNAGRRPPEATTASKAADEDDDDVEARSPTSPSIHLTSASDTEGADTDCEERLLNKDK